MGKINLLLSGLVVLVCVSAEGLAAERIRGDITGFDGHDLQVKTRDCREVKLGVTEHTMITGLTAVRMSDIKEGSFVGITAVPNGADGALQALEVHIFPETMRGTGEGHYDWDLEPGSTMTNADVIGEVEFRKGKELTLLYKGGSRQIMVPIGVPIVAIKPGGKSLLKSGAQVFIIAQPTDSGSLAAQRIAVGMYGIRPPM